MEPPQSQFHYPKLQLAHVNGWIAEYVYEMFWHCYFENEFIDMGLRFWIDGLLFQQNKRELPDTTLINQILNVIKFVLHLLDCDPEDDTDDSVREVTEKKLWELCLTFEHHGLNNLVLTHNIVAKVKRGDFEGARMLCSTLNCKDVTIDESLKTVIKACANSNNPSHSFVDKFKFTVFRDKAVEIVFDGCSPQKMFKGKSSLLSLAASRALPFHDAVLNIVCECGRHHPAPSSLRLAAETEPFENDPAAIEDFLKSNCDLDTTRCEYPTHAVTNVQKDRPTLLHTSARVATEEGAGGSSRAHSEIDVLLPVRVLPTVRRPSLSTSPPHRQDLADSPIYYDASDDDHAKGSVASGSGRESQDLMSQPLLAQQSAPIAPLTEINGSSSLFGSSEERKSTPEQNRNQATREVNEGWQTQMVHTLPYFGLPLGKIIGKVMGKSKSKTDDETEKEERKEKIVSAGERVVLRENEAPDFESESLSRRRNVEDDEQGADLGQPLPAGPSSTVVDENDDTSPDIFLGQGRRIKPRRFKRLPGSSKGIFDEDEANDENEAPQDDPEISEAETTDYNVAQRDDDLDEDVSVTTSKNVAKIPPTLAKKETPFKTKTSAIAMRKRRPTDLNEERTEKRSKKNTDLDDEEEKRFGRSSGGRRTYKLEWSQFETYHLWKGVQIYGEGSWCKIMEVYGTKFDERRTNISLKDRWRTMVKNGVDKKLARQYSKRGHHSSSKGRVVDDDDDSD